MIRRVVLSLSMVLTFLFTLSAVSPSQVLAAEDVTGNWPQWRGPTRDGKVESGDWPNTLSDKNLEKLWRVELGPSYSGPIVVGDRVFVTETKDEKYEVVRALSRKTGEEIWSAQWEGALSVPPFAKSNGDWIRSTPAYSDGRLYVAGMRDVLVCLDAETGDEIWRVDFVEKLKTEIPSFGFICSPLVRGDFVFVQAGASFAKLNKKTGEIVWRALQDNGGMKDSAFSSPSFGTLSGKPQFLVQQRRTMSSVDAESGETLWTIPIPATRGMNILSPSVANDTIFTSSYGGKSLLFRLEEKDGQLAPAKAWENKQEAYMSTPVLIDGHIYMHLRNGRLTCIEIESGETLWTSTPYGKYWSLVTNGEKILALDQRGELFLVRATPEKFELLGRQKISDQDTWAYLAVSGDEIFVRELNAISAFRWTRE